MPENVQSANDNYDFPLVFRGPRYGFLSIPKNLKPSDIDLLLGQLEAYVNNVLDVESEPPTACAESAQKEQE